MNHPSNGYGQYLRTNVNQGVISNICFSLTKRMGKFFVIPDAASADISQKIAQSQWEAKKTMEEKFDTVCTALTQIFKRIIDDSYHTGFIKVDQINQTMSWIIKHTENIKITPKGLSLPCIVGPP